MDLGILNKLLPPPLTNPFFRTPGQALDAVIKPIQQMTGIPGSYQYVEQGIGKLLSPRIGSIPPSANGESYRRAELRLADAARAGGGGGGGGNAGYSVPNFRPLGGTPEERAQAAETSRIAQLTAQDPELKRYENARLKAVAPGATPEQIQSAENIGMQMWAKANPTLAAKVKPGQAGYDAIQGTLAGQAAREGYGYQLPQQITMTPPPPGVNLPQGLPAVQSIGAAETYGPQGLEVDPEMAKKFQALLNQSRP